MTREEFFRAFRGRLLVLAAEAWAVRHCRPTELGLTMEKHHNELKTLMGEIYDALNPPAPEPRAGTNGTNGHPLRSRP